ncbi:MAG: type II secretion system protein M [Hyphomonadaceae bacterium]|nr:type II secretion system protein M [Hyphomonadaceae bacterium]
MITQLAAWWRARTSRERWLIQAAGVLVFAILLPAWVYLSAASFRDNAASALARANQVSDQITQLREAARVQGMETLGADGSLRERVLAAASSNNLSTMALEAAGPDRIRVAFESADSLAVYRWMEAMGRRGATISRTTMTRVGASDLVNAEFEVAEGP